MAQYSRLFPGSPQLLQETQVHLALRVRTYCMFYGLALQNSIKHRVEHLGTCSYEHAYCTDSNVLLILFLLTNVLIVSRFG